MNEYDSRHERSSLSKRGKAFIAWVFYILNLALVVTLIVSSLYRCDMVDYDPHTGHKMCITYMR